MICFTHGILDLMHSLWEQCNKKAHESGDSAPYEELDGMMAHHFNRGWEDMPDNMAHHFRGDLVDILQWHHSFKRAWLANVVAARECHSRQQGAGMRLTLGQRWSRQE